MSELTIEVHPRTELGKNANRRLRAEGEIPAVVYGAGLDPVPIRVDEKSVQELLRSSGGENAVFKLKLPGSDKSRNTMIRDLQADVISGSLVHIDFQRINMDQKVHVTVSIELHGEPEGVRTQGGLLDFVTREVELECLPGDIPAHLDLDVSALEVGQHVEAGQLDLPDAVDLLDDVEKVIVSVGAQRLAEGEDDDEDSDLLEAPTAEPAVIGQDPS